MSAKIDKKQPYGVDQSVSQSGAAGVNLGDYASNVSRIKRFVLKDDDGDTVIVQPREFFGTTTPTAVDYPDAEVGSVFHKFTINTVAGVKKATAYVRYELTASNTWTAK